MIVGCVALAYASPETFARAGWQIYVLTALGAGFVGSEVPGFIQLDFRGVRAVGGAAFAFMAFVLISRMHVNDSKVQSRDPSRADAGVATVGSKHDEIPAHEVGPQSSSAGAWSASDNASHKLPKPRLPTKRNPQAAVTEISQAEPKSVFVEVGNEQTVHVDRLNLDLNVEFSVLDGQNIVSIHLTGPTTQIHSTLVATGDLPRVVEASGGRYKVSLLSWDVKNRKVKLVFYPEQA